MFSTLGSARAVRINRIISFNSGLGTCKPFVTSLSIIDNLFHCCATTTWVLYCEDRNQILIENFLERTTSSGPGPALLDCSWSVFSIVRSQWKRFGRVAKYAKNQFCALLAAVFDNNNKPIQPRNAWCAKREFFVYSITPTLTHPK